MGIDKTMISFIYDNGAHYSVTFDRDHVSRNHFESNLDNYLNDGSYCLTNTPVCEIKSTYTRQDNGRKWIDDLTFDFQFEGLIFVGIYDGVRIGGPRNNTLHSVELKFATTHHHIFSEHFSALWYNPNPSFSDFHELINNWRFYKGNTNKPFKTKWILESSYTNEKNTLYFINPDRIHAIQHKAIKGK